MISKRFYKRDRFKVRDDDSKPLIGGHVEIGGSFLSRCLDPGAYYNIGGVGNRQYECEVGDIDGRWKIW